MASHRAALGISLGRVSSRTCIDQSLAFIISENWQSAMGWHINNVKICMQAC